MMATPDQQAPDSVSLSPLLTPSRNAVPPYASEVLAPPLPDESEVRRWPAWIRFLIIGLLAAGSWNLVVFATSLLR